MSTKRINELIALLAAAWPSPQMPPATVQVYRNELSQLGDIDALEDAVQELVHSSRRLPSIAELHEVYAVRARSREQQRLWARDAAGRTLADARGLASGPPVPAEPEPWHPALVAFLQEHWNGELLRAMPDDTSEPPPRGRRETA